MTRPSETDRVAAGLIEQIRNEGILLGTGAEFPSVTTVICGSPISGSWWNHKRSNLIYWVLEELDDHPELMNVKLVNSKVTIVHASFWPQLYAIGKSRQRWQTSGLSNMGRTLLRKSTKGPFRLDQFRPRTSAEKPSEVVRKLEKKLLLHSREIHTESGRHSKVLTRWEDWWQSLSVDKPGIPTTGEAKLTFEDLVKGYQVRLPWR